MRWKKQIFMAPPGAADDSTAGSISIPSWTLTQATTTSYSDPDDARALDPHAALESVGVRTARRARLLPPRREARVARRPHAGEGAPEQYPYDRHPPRRGRPADGFRDSVGRAHSGTDRARSPVGAGAGRQRGPWLASRLPRRASHQPRAGGRGRPGPPPAPPDPRV